jgi:hypothetical protein
MCSVRRPGPNVKHLGPAGGRLDVIHPAAVDAGPRLEH